jgi:hypothetical protein
MDAEKTPVKEAIEAIMGELIKADGMRLRGMNAPAEAEEEAEQKCAACAAGTCDDPEHMGEEDMAGLLASVGE